MRDYFIRLFEYDRFANELILDIIGKANNPEKPVKLMAHLFAAQWVWLSRCQSGPPFTGALWPEGEPDTFAATSAQNSAAWLNYLEGLHDNDFERIITYKSLRGDPFENKLNDLLAHVINHGTHHRAQAGQHLITAGIEQLPGTDYIMFLRQ
jgi:uncharacterized damage-inducible protein DinB